MFAWLGEKGTPIFPLFTEDSLLSVDNEQDCECSVLNTVPYFSSVAGCISNQKIGTEIRTINSVSWGHH